MTESQLLILSKLLTDNPLLVNKNTEQIREWLDDYGSASLSELTYLLTDAEMSNYLLFKNNEKNYESFPLWLGHFFENTHTEVMEYVDKEIKLMARALITEMTNNSITVNQSLQLVVQELMNRGLKKSIFKILIMGVADNILTEYTGYKILAEVNNTDKRYKAIGLTELPTIEDIELCL
jgi:hypothetical protein